MRSRLISDGVDSMIVIEPVLTRHHQQQHEGAMSLVGSKQGKINAIPLPKAGSNFSQGFWPVECADRRQRGGFFAIKGQKAAAMNTERGRAGTLKWDVRCAERILLNYR